MQSLDPKHRLNLHLAFPTFGYLPLKTWVFRDFLENQGSTIVLITKEHAVLTKLEFFPL